MKGFEKLFVALSVLLAVSCAAPGPKLVSAPDRTNPVRRSYSPLAGEFPVGVIPEATLRDAARGKDVPISIEYPTRPGPHPVIIFSPAFGGSRRAYEGLASYWTSHGYVVIRVSHADAGRVKDPREAESGWDSQTVDEWRNRAGDIKAVVDGFPALETSYPELKGKMDPSRIGVGGHSYGAFTAMLLAGMVAEKSGVRVGAADPRVKAVLAMVPPGRSPERGLGDDSWRGLNIPTLFQIGSSSRGSSDRPEAARGSRASEPLIAEVPVDWRTDAWELSAPGEKYLVIIRGARPMSFTGRLDDLDDAEIERRRRAIRDQNPVPVPGTMPTAVQRPIPGAFEAISGRERRVFAHIKSSSLAFWDSMLRGETSGRDYLSKLTSDDVEVRTR